MKMDDVTLDSLGVTGEESVKEVLEKLSGKFDFSKSDEDYEIQPGSNTKTLKSGSRTQMQASLFCKIIDEMKGRFSNSEDKANKHDDVSMFEEKFSSNSTCDQSMPNTPIKNMIKDPNSESNQKKVNNLNDLGNISLKDFYQNAVSYTDIQNYKYSTPQKVLKEINEDDESPVKENLDEISDDSEFNTSSDEEDKTSLLSQRFHSIFISIYNSDYDRIEELRNEIFSYQLDSKETESFIIDAIQSCMIGAKKQIHKSITEDLNCSYNQICGYRK